jgi:K+-transporting ATPase ATPase C chain
MWEQILPGLRIKIFLTVVLGVIYPLAMTGISQVLFSKQANGSLITNGGKVIGSEIIGQDFSIPADLVTASSSGLDPHISPDSARAQGPRVAKARGIAVEQVNALITQSTEQPTFGVLGEPRVNVLKLNLALDEQYQRK